MSAIEGPNIIKNSLILSLDVGNPKLKRGSLYYRWFNTNGTNPTTKSGFDSFFSGSPQAFGLHNGEINWLTVNDRPSYLTPTVSFAWEVSGFIIINTSGQYTFNTRSDDGNELQINGQVVTSFYGGRGVPTPGDVSSPVTLERGVYTFQYRMQQGGGGAGAQVRWITPTTSTYEVIPSDNLAVGLPNNVIIDNSRNNNDGLLINGPTFNNDNFGSLVFDGVNQRIVCGNFNVTPHLTLDVWVYRTSTANNQGICRKNNVWALSHFNGTLQVAPGTNWTFFNTGYTIPLNQWVNIVYTYNGTNQIVYVNGVSIFNNTSASGNLPTNTNDVRIAFDDNNWWWGGRISKTKIYNIALTPSEIQQNFNANKRRFGL